jgi:FMN phosphatase YigB (HAD superfamily)
MEDLFRAVAARVRVGLLSDTDPLHWACLRARFPFLCTIACPTLSYEVKAVKPEPAIYAAAVRNVGVPPEDYFFTDDVSANVEGARAAGLQAEVFTGPAALRARLAALGVLEYDPALRSVRSSGVGEPDR